MAINKKQIKINSLAKDFDMKTKDLGDALAEAGLERKTSGMIDPDEFAVFLNHITASNQTTNMTDYLAGKADIPQKSPEPKTETPAKTSNRQKTAKSTQGKEAPVKETPVKDEQPKEVIAKEAPVKAEQPKEAIAKETPAKAEQPKEVIAKEAPAKAEQPKEVVAKETPAKVEQPKEVVAKEAPVKAEQPKEVIAKEAPVKAEQPKEVIAKEPPAKPAQTKEIPAKEPFMAISFPPTFTSGSVYSNKAGRRATARDVTISNCSLISPRPASSPLACTPVTEYPSFSASLTAN